MEVQRMIKLNVSTFKIGDIIEFRLTGGEKVQAMAVQREVDGMIFCFVDCLKQEYPMNNTATNEGGYENSLLRKKLNGEIFSRLPYNIRSVLVPFENDDYLRLPTEVEIFGENTYGEAEDTDVVEQWKPMKKRKNRIAFQGNGTDDWEWYWLQNNARNYAATFAYVNPYGCANCGNASHYFGVRPVFKIRNLSAEKDGRRD